MSYQLEIHVHDNYVLLHTVEPLLMDTPYKGHNKIYLHIIKDRFNGPKCRTSYLNNRSQGVLYMEVLLFEELVIKTLKYFNQFN